jgi:hypothetical protein
VSISLDDFGTGYSSVLYLRKLPIDEIKIDRVFTAGIGSDGDDDAIVAGLIRLAHAVGVTTVAEGVETLEQAEALAVLGCDVGQGYLYGRPSGDFVLTAAVEAAAASSRRSRRARRRPPPQVAAKEAQNVIRRLIPEGASLHTIAAALNQHGVHTTDGARWTGATVGRAVDQMFQAGAWPNE